MIERATLKVSTSSWHGRIYRYWQEHAGEFKPRSSYSENLCHYVRVLLFWAPLTWLITWSPLGLWWATPIVLVALAAVGVGLWLSVSGMLAAGLMVLLLFAVFGIARWAAAHEEALGKWFSTWWLIFPCLGSAALGAAVARWPIWTLLGIGGLVAFMAAGLLLACIAVGIETLVKRYKERKNPSERGASASSVAIEFVKARKARICPFIDVQA